MNKKIEENIRQILKRKKEKEEIENNIYRKLGYKEKGLDKWDKK